MDLGGAFSNLGAFDVVALVIVGLGLVSGVLQGAVRRILGIVIAVFVFVVAANLRGPVGDALARYWRADTPEYAAFIGLGATFAVLYVVAMLAAQVYVKRITLFPKSDIADDIVGGLVGALEAIVLIGVVILVMDSYFRVHPSAGSSNEMGLLRSVFDFYDHSLTVHVYRDFLGPVFMAGVGWTLPESLRALIAH